MHVSYCFSLFLYICHASGESVFNGYEQHNDLPRLLNLEDSRNDGITREINKALVAEHSKATQHGDSLEDLLQPGGHHISLSFWDDWTTRRSDDFIVVLNGSNLSQESTWRLDVQGGWAYNGNMSLLADFIHTLPAITELHWETKRMIPAIVLESLQTNHPSCRLYYTIPLSTFGNGQSNDQLPYNIGVGRTPQNILHIEETRKIIEATTPRSILHSKNLYSLKAHIDHKLASPTEKLDLIHQILLTCPNVRELDLKIVIASCVDPTKNCCEDPSVNAVLAFDFTKQKGRLPPLEVLKLYGYRLDFAVNGSYAESEVNMLLEMANLHAWFDHMDWSHVKSLYLSNPLRATLRRLIADRLPNLQHFHIDGGELSHVRAEVVEYLPKLPVLQSLAIQEADLHPLDSLLDVIAEHHTTLRSFKINHRQDVPKTQEVGDRIWLSHFQYPAGTFLSSTQLKRLFSICPDLQSLDLDINTEAGWDYETIDTLLSFPRLKELTLRFPPEMSDQYFSPLAGRNIVSPELRITMKGLRDYLREKKVGERLEVVKTFLGYIEFKDVDDEEEQVRATTHMIW